MKARILSLVIALVIACALFHPLQAQAPTSGAVNTTANIRSGPSTVFRVIGTLTAGSPVSILSCNSTCSWYQIGTHQWIASSLVDTGGTHATATPASIPPSTSNTTPIPATNAETFSLEERNYMEWLLESAASYASMFGIDGFDRDGDGLACKS